MGSKTKQAILLLFALYFLIHAAAAARNKMVTMATNSPDDGEHGVLEKSVKLDSPNVKHDPFCGGHIGLDLCGSHPPPVPPGYDPFCGGHIGLDLCGSSSSSSSGGRLAIANAAIISTLIFSVFILVK